MTTTKNAAAIAIIKIADLFGNDFVRTNFKDACISYPPDDYKEAEFDFFCGFTGDERKNAWTVFAYVRVDRGTREAVLLDYKLPNGERMENPIKPIRFV